MDANQKKPRVLVFEWLVGGGLFVDDQPLDVKTSMFRQGAEMRRAIADDFAAAGCEVISPTDCRWQSCIQSEKSVAVTSGIHLPSQLRELAAEADFLFVVAPESAGRLLRVLDWLEPFQERLLSPSRPWVELFGDKQSSCDWLQRLGVRVPSGQSWSCSRQTWPPSVALPAVCKPNDGCGGEGIKLVYRDWGEIAELGTGEWRIESLVDGLPLSVAAIVGSGRHLLLQPTRQLFNDSEFGTYVGGEMVEDPKVVAAVRPVVERALEAMPGIRGIIGFDLVLQEKGEIQRVRDSCGERQDGGGSREVTVVEVNPRLTTSYLGLREYYAGNLAERLLCLIRGESVAPLAKCIGKDQLSWSVG